MDRQNRESSHRKLSEEKKEERFFSMICFQSGICLLAAAAFFTASQAGGEAKRAAIEAAELICGVGEECFWDNQQAKKLILGVRDSVCHFWNGGAEEILEQIQQTVSRQLVPYEEQFKETLGASGQGGELPAPTLKQAQEGTTLAPYLLTAQMRSPVSGPITSLFGWREHPVSGEEDFHKGVDIAAAQGSDIFAALPGVVEQTGYNDSYGNFVILRHSDRLRTTYNHCSEILAKEGEHLARGDRIALVGSTGISTGPHLHFEVEIQGKKANPLFSLKVREKDEAADN